MSVRTVAQVQMVIPDGPVLALRLSYGQGADGTSSAPFVAQERARGGSMQMVLPSDPFLDDRAFRGWGADGVSG